MRHTHIRRPGLLIGLPTALVGSLAVSLGATAACAAEPEPRSESRSHLSAVPALRASTPVGVTAETAGAREISVAARATTASTYTVRRGDTLWAIASTHKVSLDSLLSTNRLSRSSIIYPGQKLRIPGTSTAAKTTSSSGTSPKASGASTYTVRKGDALWAIASTHQVSLDALLAANRLSKSSIIYPGQKLRIPGPGAAPALASSSAKITKLDKEQTANARIIIAVGRKLGVPDRGIAIALGTAMQESWLRNLDWGDRDSLGLFQQRPSTGWGTAAQIRDRERATRAFFGGPKDPNGSRTRGLLDIPGWQKLSFAKAAQAVQVSAYPGRYAKWEDDAYAWLDALG